MRTQAEVDALRNVMTFEWSDARLVEVGKALRGGYAVQVGGCWYHPVGEPYYNRLRDTVSFKMELNPFMY